VVGYLSTAVDSNRKGLIEAITPNWDEVL